ncbi:unnamed protein product [Amaranthus hypochondriacus]
MEEGAKTVLDIVLSRAIQEVSLAMEFKGDLQKMAGGLQMINAILNTSEVDIYDSDTQMSDPIQLWLRKVQHIGHEVENILDLIAYEKVRQGLGSKIKLFFSSSNPIYFRQSMAHRISSLNKTIKEVEKEGKNVGTIVANLKTHNANASNATTKNTHILKQLREFVEVSNNIVGREDDEKRLVNMLCSSYNHNLPVVALLGVGGLGKTTIAKKVMDNEEVKVRFGQRICIVVSQDFDILKILNKILEFIDESTGGNANSDIAVRKLKEALYEKTYLLVLDDVWNTDQQLWNAMRSSLECIGRSKESVILVTTRDNAVTQTMQASSVLALPELSDENSLSLFKQIAFAKISSDEDISILKGIGEKIVRKCKGVPLAIKTIAGILQIKRTTYAWEVIKNSELWDIKSGILPSLKLSYDYLPSRFLKKCFTLCALWPRGTRFEKYEIVGRWMALGLIQESNNRHITLYDVAEEYFNIFLGISFIIVYQRKELGDQAIKYTMHDLVYDLARSVAMHERLYLEDGKKKNYVLDIEHVSVFKHEEIGTKNLVDKLSHKNIRSLEAWNNFSGDSLLIYLKYLRILYLEHSRIQVVPKSIAELKCLKYFGLARNPIKVLPKCITKLYNLQSLILYMCKELSDLPPGLGNLVNLQHLGLSFCYCPAEGVIRQLSHLQILPPLQLSEGGFQIVELENLHHIRGNLEIKGLQLVKSKQEAEKAHLSSKSRVEQMSLIWDNADNQTKHEEILKALHPNPNLKKLLIKGFAGETFSSWMSRLALLQKIQLVDCGKCKQLPTLGDLCCLKILEITNMDSLNRISPEFYYGSESILHNDIEATCSSSSRSQEKPIAYFPRLKELRVRGLANLAEWCDPASSKEWTIFPSLEEFSIEDCPILIKTPKKFPFLKKLKVKNITSNQPLLDIMSESSNLTALDSLHIEMVSELTCLSPNLTECACLQSLKIIKCHSLTRLPEHLSKLSSLQVLKISRCPELVSIPSLNDLRLLRELEICNNISLRGDPKWMLNCKSLEELWIYYCPKVKALPDLKELSRLSNVCIVGMTSLILEPPIWLYILPCLRTLHIGGYEELSYFPDISPLLTIAPLKILHVYGWEKLKGVPEQVQQFKALQKLIICEFRNIEELPDWIQDLSSLEVLSLIRCNKLQKLASTEAMERLTKLQALTVRDCPLLKENINPNGSEYQKIAHVIVETYPRVRS